MSTEAEDRPAPPRWSWPELVLVFLFGTLTPAFVYEGLVRVGFYHALYGEAAVEAAKSSNIERMRLYLWALAIAAPLQIGGVLALLWNICRATPAEVGLHVRDLGRQLGLALTWAVGLIPIVYGVQALVLWVMIVLGVPVQPHDFTRLAQQGLTPAEWGMLAVAAVVVAPVWEEVYFRGLVQRWVIGTGTQGEQIALAVALFVAITSRLALINDALNTLPQSLSTSYCMMTARGGLLNELNALKGLMIAILPALCVLALVGVWRLLGRRPGPTSGLFATAVLFAFVHTSAWPSPIPLLFLALGLGHLTQTTKSIIGAIVLHALFNGVALLLLVLTIIKG